MNTGNLVKVKLCSTYTVIYYITFIMFLNILRSIQKNKIIKYTHIGIINSLKKMYTIFFFFLKKILYIYFIFALVVSFTVCPFLKNGLIYFVTEFISVFNSLYSIALSEYDCLLSKTKLYRLGAYQIYSSFISYINIFFIIL